MCAKTKRVMMLAELDDQQEADLYLLLTAKEVLSTRDGKPYHRVGFRDASREIVFPIWSDSAWAGPCRDEWQPGTFFKVRAVFRQTQWGPQLEILRIRPVNDEDRRNGFHPGWCLPSSRFDPQAMFDELIALAQHEIDDAGLRDLVLTIYRQNRETLLSLPAAVRHHHAFYGGFLEHVRNVARVCLFLADRYAELYPDLQPPLSKSLILAGALLHDIGKLCELEVRPEGTAYTAAGRLIGHVVQGRDIVRQAAAEVDIDPELLLRLEHLILAHQRLPEWGSPKPPMIPEALLVHYADDLDAKMHACYAALQEEPEGGPFTAGRNALGYPLYRGP